MIRPGRRRRASTLRRPLPLPFAFGAGLLAGMVLFTAVAGQTFAQAPVKLTVNGVTVSGASVIASVTVADSSGKPIAGLADTSFAVEVDGRAVSGIELDSNVDSALPLGMVLTMDISNTMTPASIAGAKDAFSGLIRSLRSTDEATLVTISTQVTQVVKPTSDQAALIAGVAWRAHGKSRSGVKAAIGKLSVPRDLREQVLLSGLQILPLDADHGLGVADLPMHHRDPFNRLLIAQVRSEQLTIITADSRIADYDVAFIDAG